MKTVIITGSTRGIGFGLADHFLRRGCAVVVSGRTQPGVDQAVSTLLVKHDTRQVFGVPCEVTEFAQVQALWEAAKAHFGQVDIWVNNAGVSRPQRNVWENPPEDLQAVITTNVLGTLYGSKVAITSMLAQGFGAVYNLEGFGATGGRMFGQALYGMTKYALAYLNRSLSAETKKTPILVGAIRPGMVATEMLSDQYKGRPKEWERARRIFNILADPVDEVAPWAVEKMLTNTRSGVVFKRNSGPGIMLRFLVAPFRKRELFP